MSTEVCVSDYIRRFRTAARSEKAFYSGQPTLVDAITTAARCRTANGKRHPHQCRISSGVLSEAARRLMSGMEELSAAQDFEELYNVVNHTLGPITGIGELTVYDTAQRIGAFLGLEPEKVYLHAGTRVGAAALGLSGKVISMDDLPITFAQLTPAEVEDCLCIYKDAFGGVGIASLGCGGQIPASHCTPEVRKVVRSC